MALYRLETKIINRQGRAKSVIPAAAYRSGSILHKAAYRSGNVLTDAIERMKFDYKARNQEVVHTEIMGPEKGPSWLQTPVQNQGDKAYERDMRERLWNTIEKVEKRKDSQLAREFIAALPRELSREQQVELVRNWCRDEFVKKGFVVDFALHKSKNGKNPHTHILVTTRPMEGEGFGKKPSMDGKFNSRGAVGKGAKADLVNWRRSWENHANAVLEKAGREERVDCRSLKDRGLDRLPEPKLGAKATAMMRRGLDPERFKLWRWVKSLNSARPFMQAIERVGEVFESGMGKTWLEKTLLSVAQKTKGFGNSVLDAWQDLSQSRAPAPEIPTREREPDIER